MYAKIDRKTAVQMVDKAITAANVGRDLPYDSPEKITVGRDGRITVAWFRYQDRSVFNAALREVASARGFEIDIEYGRHGNEIAFSLTRVDHSFEAAVLGLEIGIADRNLAALAEEIEGPFIYARDFERAARIAAYNRTGEYFTAGGYRVFSVFTRNIRLQKNGRARETEFYDLWAFVGTGAIPTAIVNLAPLQKLQRHTGGDPDLVVEHCHYDSINLQYKFLRSTSRDGKPNYSEVIAYVRYDRYGSNRWSVEINWSSYGSNDVGMAARFAQAIQVLIPIAESWAAALNSVEFFIPLPLRDMYRKA